MCLNVLPHAKALPNQTGHGAIPTSIAHLTAAVRHVLKASQVRRKYGRLALQLATRQPAGGLGQATRAPPHPDPKQTRCVQGIAVVRLGRAAHAIRAPDRQFCFDEAAAPHVDGGGAGYAPQTSGPRLLWGQAVGGDRGGGHNGRQSSDAWLVAGWTGLPGHLQEAVEPQHADGVRQGRQDGVSCERQCAVIVTSGGATELARPGSRA